MARRQAPHNRFSTRVAVQNIGVAGNWERTSRLGSGGIYRANPVAGTARFEFINGVTNPCAIRSRTSAWAASREQDSNSRRNSFALLAVQAFSGLLEL